MPSWMRDESKWSKAKAAARKQYPDLSEDDDKYWAIVTHIYKRMGGRIAAAKAGRFTLVFTSRH